MDASYIPIAEARGFTTHWIKTFSGLASLQKYARNTLIRIPPYDSALFLLYVMKIPLSLIHLCDKYTIKLYFII